ncbi:MAG: PepSY-like domain-containing protein [Candidatus Thiodiazotropha sp. (ex Ctena orbiculata)]|nr:PepSY-like domain-containing protein [Candidatus Thiodiazotropha taylori]
MRLLAITGLLFTLGVTPAWAGTEKEINLSEVPQTVMNALKKRFQSATLLSANTETEEDGSMVYEIQGKLSDGHLAEFDIFPDGRFEEVEVIFPVEMVPGAVLKALQKKMAGFVPSKIEATHSASMKVVGYEFEGTLNGQKIDLEVSADGRTITVADQ